MKKYLKLITPFSKVSTNIMSTMLIIELSLFLIAWVILDITFLPSPMETWNAGMSLISNEGLVAEFWVSIKLCLRAMFYATIISAIISYLYLIPVTKYISLLITKGRFLTLVGLSFFFTMFTGSGTSLKTSLLVFGITVFFTTSFIAYIKAIPETQYNHARTLGLGPWETLFEVVIYGRLAHLMEVVAQTFAIAWTMLTLVEGIVRSEGGIGVMLLNMSRYLKLDAILFIQILICITGIFLDMFWSYMREIVAPYTKYQTQNK